MIGRSARILAIFLLLLNAIGALYGGSSLTMDPTGVNLQLPADWIHRLPFRNYFIPGILLLLINGLFSILVAAATIIRRPGYEKYIMIQGALLSVWILVQVAIVNATEFLHFAMFGIGLTLIGLGMILFINNAHDGVRG